jgi:hypothetical protein
MIQRHYYNRDNDGQANIRYSVAVQQLADLLVHRALYVVSHSGCTIVAQSPHYHHETGHHFESTIRALHYPLEHNMILKELTTEWQWQL